LISTVIKYLGTTPIWTFESKGNEDAINKFFIFYSYFDRNNLNLFNLHFTFIILLIVKVVMLPTEIFTTLLKKFPIFSLHFLSSNFILTDLSQLSKLTNPYDVYSLNYDDINGGRLSGSLGANDLRSFASSFAVGDVLEVAIGTGLQLGYYDWSRIKSYKGIDSSQEMLKQVLTTC